MAVTSIDPSIKVVKQFTYRGTTRKFSNRYYFDNLSPTDTTKWTALCDAVTAAEKAIWHSTSTVTIISALGYNAGSDVAVFTKAYSLAGTGAWTTTPTAPGDCAALVRYSTAQRSTKNHPIYLFNYYHAMKLASAGGGDAMDTNQINALSTYANLWVAGFSDGAVTHHRCGPQGHVATGISVGSYIRHRDLPAG